MTLRPVTFLRSLAIGVLASSIPCVFCFYLLEFRDGWLVRALGPARAYSLAGLAFALLAAFPLSRIVSTRRPGRFVVVFSLLCVVAMALMVAVLRLRPDRTGGYAAGFAAIWFLGSAIGYYLRPHWDSLVIGLLLAGWVFIGDYTGYHARTVIAGVAGAMVYAMSYSVFLGSGLGTILWRAQADSVPTSGAPGE